MHCPAVQGRDGEHEKDPNQVLEMAKNLMFGFFQLLTTDNNSHGMQIKLQLSIQASKQYHVTCM